LPLLAAPAIPPLTGCSPQCGAGPLERSSCPQRYPKTCDNSTRSLAVKCLSSCAGPAVTSHSSRAWQVTQSVVQDMHSPWAPRHPEHSREIRRRRASVPYGTGPHPSCPPLLPVGAVGLGHQGLACQLPNAPVFSSTELQSVCSRPRSAEQELAEKCEAAAHSKGLRTSPTVTGAAEHLGVHNS